jgi:hypothetical protein
MSAGLSPLLAAMGNARALQKYQLIVPGVPGNRHPCQQLIIWRFQSR